MSEWTLHEDYPHGTDFWAMEYPEGGGFPLTLDGPFGHLDWQFDNWYRDGDGNWFAAEMEDYSGKVMELGICTEEMWEYVTGETHEKR